MPKTNQSPREDQQMPDDKDKDKDKDKEDRLFGLSSFLGSPGEDPIGDFVEDIFGDPDASREDDDHEQADGEESQN
jgi:hypothetical protein